MTNDIRPYYARSVKELATSDDYTVKFSVICLPKDLEEVFDWVYDSWDPLCYGTIFTESIPDNDTGEIALFFSRSRTCD